MRWFRGGGRRCASRSAFGALHLTNGYRDKDREFTEPQRFT
ncbi:MAG TPA: hypothetical protein VFC19_03285 [Candidatus Limnocylindrales bacterium]|nr:hypothetical protein [Candidatus Limnocylindrales bacterium]